MSHLRITNVPVHSLKPDQQSRPGCRGSALKISLFVIGAMLIGCAIGLAAASHTYPINSISIYPLGGIGGVLILSSMLISVVQCISRRGLKTRVMKEGKKQFETQKQAYDAQSKWYALARTGDIQAIQEGLQNKNLPPLTRLLDIAASEGHADLVSLLLENGAKPKLTSQYDPSLGYSALHKAVICQDNQKGLDTMRVLLAKDPTLALVKARFKNLTPLHLAASGGVEENPDIHKQKVELLIKNGAAINAQDSDENTPLHEAAAGTTLSLSNPNIEVIEILVRAGAQWTAKNKEGETPWRVAQKKHPQWSVDPDIQKRLLSLTPMLPPK